MKVIRNEMVYYIPKDSNWNTHIPNNTNNANNLLYETPTGMAIQPGEKQINKTKTTP